MVNIIKFCIVVIFTVTLLVVLIEAGVFLGVIFPANYKENLINEATAHIDDYDSYDSWVPDGCIYSVYNKNGVIKESNTEKNESIIMWKEVESGALNKGSWYYKKIINKDEICIVKYKIQTEYSSQLMNKYLPQPAEFAVLLFIVMFIAEVVLFCNYFTRRLAKELCNLKETTDKIQMNNLEFKVENSEIVEINDVLSSIDKMKNELQKSLKAQWHLEEIKRKQVSALAHDIKTPLTVLRGNSELMEETALDEEQRAYNVSIQHSIANMEQYLSTLLDIMCLEKSENQVFGEISIKPFLDGIVLDVAALIVSKNIRFQINNSSTLQMIYADEVAVKRAIMNLVSNAIDYTPDFDRIELSVSNDEKYIYFVVEDSGKGFSAEELKLATEQFYQGDKSRKVKNHYGLGLYIVDNLVKNHGGTVNLSNSERTGGAKVMIKLPIAFSIITS